MRPPIRFAVSMLAVLAAAPVLVGAQNLAVPGRTPGNAHFIVSMPESAPVWEQLRGTPMHAAVESAAARLMGLGDPHDPEAAMLFDGLEEELGYSLRPGDFFTGTSSGLDLYFLDQGGQGGYLANIAFQTPGAAAAAFNQIRSDAAHARGVSRGVTAETALETVSGTARMLELPAFEVFVAVEDNILTYGTQKRFVESALANEGGVLFQSNYFRSFMDPLAGEGSDLWVFGEPHWALDLASNAEALALPRAFLGRYRSIAVKFRVEEDGIHAASFVPQAEMAPAERRFNLAAPPPSRISVLDAVPSGALFSYTTNSFDGVYLLESAFDSLESGEASALAISTEAVEQAIETSRTLLGFDLQDDLLANLGPDLAVALWSTPAGGNGTAGTEALLVSHVRDPERVQRVLTILEELLDNSLPAIPQPTGTAADATPTPAPALYHDATIAGETARLVNPERIPEGNDWPIPSYTFTRQGRLVMALSEEGLRRSLAASQGRAPSLRDDSAHEGHAVNGGDGTLNAQWFLRLPELQEHADLLGRFPLDGPGIPRLEMMESFSLGEVYTPEGTRREFLFLLPAGE